MSPRKEEWWSSVLKGGCVWVTHTLNTRVVRSQEGVTVKSMIDLGLVKKDILHYAQGVRSVKGRMGRGLSDHHVVLCKVRLVGTRIKRREVVE